MRDQLARDSILLSPKKNQYTAAMAHGDILYCAVWMFKVYQRIDSYYDRNVGSRENIVDKRYSSNHLII
jgi:hypothetical protein